MVLFCEDLLGRRFRFVVMEQPTTGARFVYPPEIWRPGWQGAPRWVTDPAVWAG